LPYTGGVKKLVVILIIVFLIVTPYLWYRHALSPTGSAGDASVTVRVEQGAFTAAIAQTLRDKGLIRSVWAFKWYVRRHGDAGALKAGAFGLEPSMGVPAIVDVLTGRTEGAGKTTVTVPEGYTVRDIDRLLAEKGLAREGEVEECARTCAFSGFTFLPSAAGLAQRGGRLEGYLFPDTYFVQVGDVTAEAFLTRMLENFRKRVLDGLADDLHASSRSTQEIITMASLIEKETRTDDERPTVSGILWKRLDAGMGLGVDAAVRYIVAKPTGAIIASDLGTDSPYNLRKFRGLPPGPIANPGLASIRAALHPEETDYLYYLHDAQGRIHYAKTNEEHNLNRERYL